MKFVVLVFALFGAAVLAEEAEPIAILRQETVVNPDSYEYAYETANGIAAEERGSLKNAGSEQASIQSQGQYQYTAPDGQVIRVVYTADENGFHAQGDHIPTSPPVPAAIQRSLEYIAAHAPPAEDQQ